ncbi:SRPBCC family protein [Sinomonas atrocyanea]|uniref:SRPBCC family protein n=1 Tax=Sinomonas atrocyanea TaxID=37927 RepID=UPI00277DB226|nr:SRPBCC family protein [Sinomonas atrocyanea]MDQ0260284.1 carbon monoxide dehydrogenase subunit G [Sinomonas atrocyanea]MDR6620345.1 carbon monoxide dehydrogenase subunit G [Sinomonas atrocyanea]
MPTTDESIVIAASPERVFAYLEDPANLPSYQATILRAESDGPAAVGTRIRGTSKILGRTFDWTMEVTEHELPTRFALKSVEGKISFTSAFTLAPEGEGTRVNYRLDADPGLGGVFGRIADPLVNKVYSRQIRADLETLSQILTEHGD